MFCIFFFALPLATQRAPRSSHLEHTRNSVRIRPRIPSIAGIVRKRWCVPAMFQTPGTHSKLGRRKTNSVRIRPRIPSIPGIARRRLGVFQRCSRPSFSLHPFASFFPPFLFVFFCGEFFFLLNNQKKNKKFTRTALSPNALGREKRRGGGGGRG